MPSVLPKSHPETPSLPGNVMAEFGPTDFGQTRVWPNYGACVCCCFLCVRVVCVVGCVGCVGCVGVVQIFVGVVCWVCVGCVLGVAEC